MRVREPASHSPQDREVEKPVADGKGDQRREDNALEISARDPLSIQNDEGAKVGKHTCEPSRNAKLQDCHWIELGAEERFLRFKRTLHDGATSIKHANNRVFGFNGGRLGIAAADDNNSVRP